MVETMVSSVIIVIVFMIASMSLNNIFGNVVKNNDLALRNRVKEVTYLAQNSALQIPFYEDTEAWELVVDRKNDGLWLQVFNKVTDHEMEIEVIYAKTD